MKKKSYKKIWFFLISDQNLPCSCEPSIQRAASKYFSYIGYKNFDMFIPCGNTDGTDQPVHPLSLINIFVVHYEDSFVLIQAKCIIL